MSIITRISNYLTTRWAKKEIARLTSILPTQGYYGHVLSIQVEEAPMCPDKGEPCNLCNACNMPDGIASF